MNKRIVSKEIILNSSWDSIKGISRAEALIIRDNWSSIFLQNLDNIDKYQKRRQKALDKVAKENRIEEIINIIKESNLSHVSNLILNLNLNPSPVDYYLASDIVGSEGKIFVDSHFDLLVNEFLSKMRSDKISKIIK